MQTVDNINLLQTRLLDVIPANLNPDDIENIRKLIIKYLAEKASDEADKFWDEKGFKSAKDMENYLGES